MSETATKVTATDLLNSLNELKENQSKLQAQLNEATKTNSTARSNPFGAPHARKGEDPLSSRGFQFSRLVGVMTKKLDAGQAKVEIDLANRLQNEYVARGLYTKAETNSILVPFSSELIFQADDGCSKLAQEVGEITRAGVQGCDPDEMAYIRRTVYGRTKALSWQDESGLGNLVPFPEMGEPIELLRNQEVFMKAGARVIPFPASGRAVWPRFTGATTAYWVGTTTQSRTITASEPTTGDVVLQAKKLAVKVDVPNELFRFPTVSVEAILRFDMTRSAALQMDKSFLEATGSQLEPKGLIKYSNILSHTASTVGVDGNTLEPEDILQMIAKVEEKNLQFGSWIGRPLMYAAIGNRRADAVTAGDKKGMFLFNLLRDGTSASRDVTNASVGQLEGYPFFKTNQVSNTRTKGSASNLSYMLGGDFSQYMIAMSGVMEVLVTNQGDTNFSTDSSSIRLITWADGVPRHEEAFVLCDSLIVG